MPKEILFLVEESPEGGNSKRTRPVTLSIHKGKL